MSNENLNLVKILKDCPKGTELYSLIHGDVKLESIQASGLYTISYRTESYEIYWVTSNGKSNASYNGECTLFPSKEQQDWSKFKPKKPTFDPKTFQPFDKVLVRDSYKDRWRCAFYSHKRENNERMYEYITTGSSLGNEYCIPYNEYTKHLAGTKEDAPEFYRYWED